MRQVITALIATTCFAFCFNGGTRAQAPNPANGVSVGFRNRTGKAVIVQGFTVINNVQRRGQTLLVPPQGGMAFEANVPNGFRYYTIYDANQTARVFLRDYAVPIQGRDLFFTIEVSPVNPNLFILRPAPNP